MPFPFARRVKEMVHKGKINSARRKVGQVSQAKLSSARRMGLRRQRHAKVGSPAAHKGTQRLRRLNLGRVKRE